jgi:hypothetical protein
MDARVALHNRALACTWCQQPLSALRALRRDVCERPSCLQQADQRQQRAARAAAAQSLRGQQSAALGPARAQALRVLWILPHDTQLVDLPAALRDEHAAWLRELADGAEGVAAAAPAPQAAPVARAEGQLCGWCGGRCCRFGGENHAYLNAGHLRRWQQAHPGSSLQDAATAYIERLPARHVAGSCMHHGERGCTLDRDMRSDVCNLFACDGLRDVQVRAAQAPDDEWLFVMGPRAEVQATALATTSELIPQAPGPA